MPSPADQVGRPIHAHASSYRDAPKLEASVIERCGSCEHPRPSRHCRAPIGPVAQGARLVVRMEQVKCSIGRGPHYCISIVHACRQQQLVLVIVPPQPPNPAARGQLAGAERLGRVPYIPHLQAGSDAGM